MYFINALYTLRYLSNPLYYLSFFISIVISLITFSSAIEYEYLTNELVTFNGCFLFQIILHKI